MGGRTSVRPFPSFDLGAVASGVRKHYRSDICRENGNEAANAGFLIGFAWLGQAQLDASLVGSRSHVMPQQPLQFLVSINFGMPQVSAGLCSIRATSWPDGPLHFHRDRLVRSIIDNGQRPKHAPQSRAIKHGVDRSDLVGCVRLKRQLMLRAAEPSYVGTPAARHADTGAEQFVVQLQIFL
ncbi:TPA: hypothetical protein UMY98_000317 [Stenotrophomonas maltophilia]|nr:hypothetical protein [Stenotrophomonas maltophilia]